MEKNKKETGNNIEIISDSRERGTHPNSLNNLKKFEKGQSGNLLGGGVKYQKLAKALKSKADYVTPHIDWREQILDEGNDSRTNKEKVIDKIWNEAQEGNIKYVELLAKLGCLD